MGILKRALASVLAAGSVGVSAAPVENQELPEDNQEKTQHVMTVDKESERNEAEKAVYTASANAQGIADTLVDVALFPAEVAVDLVTDGLVRPLATGFDKLGQVTGDPVSPILSSALYGAADITNASVRAVGDVTKTAVQTTTDVAGGVAQAGVTLASGKPEQAARDLAGNIVKNTARLTGAVVESGSSVIAEGVESGGNLALTAIHHTTAPIRDTLTDASALAFKAGLDNEQDKRRVDFIAEQAKAVSYGVNSTAKTVNETAADGIRLAGGVVGKGLDIAGNVTDAAIRGDLNEVGEALNPHVDAFAKEVKEDTQENVRNIKTLANGAARLAKMPATIAEDVVSDKNALNKVAEDMYMTNVGVATGDAMLSMTSKNTLRTTLKSLSQAQMGVTVANETAKMDAHQEPDTQNTLATIVGLGRIRAQK